MVALVRMKKRSLVVGLGPAFPTFTTGSANHAPLMEDKSCVWFSQIIWGGIRKPGNVLAFAICQTARSEMYLGLLAETALADLTRCQFLDSDNTSLGDQ